MSDLFDNEEYNSTTIDDSDNNESDSEITPDLDRLKNLIGKVKGLADRGVDGERDSAQNTLEKLLNKYGIKLKDIEQQNKTKRTFRIVNKDDCITVLSQIIWDVVPDAKIKQHIRALEIYCSLTNEQYIEVSEKYQYYWKLWCEEKQHTLIAFVVKNNLGVNHNEGSKKLDEKTIKGAKDKMATVTKGNYINKKTKLIN
jgi:hypothetical protein